MTGPYLSDPSKYVVRPNRGPAPKSADDFSELYDRVAALADAEERAKNGKVNKCSKIVQSKGYLRIISGFGGDPDGPFSGRPIPS